MSNNQIGNEQERTFNEILAIEPELKQLKCEAIEYMSNSLGGYWKRNRFWYRGLKPRFVHLVGFMAQKPEIQTSGDYDTVYAGFLQILKI